MRSNSRRTDEFLSPTSRQRVSAQRGRSRQLSLDPRKLPDRCQHSMISRRSTTDQSSRPPTMPARSKVKKVKWYSSPEQSQNSLPPAVINCVTLSVFKSSLKLTCSIFNLIASLPVPPAPLNYTALGLLRSTSVLLLLLLLLRSATCHTGSHSVTWHPTQVNSLRRQASIRFTYTRRDRRLSLRHRFSLTFLPQVTSHFVSKLYVVSWP